MESGTEDWNQGRQLLLQRCKSRALSCLNEHEYSRAFAHFIVALTVEPSVKGELLNAFLFTLGKFKIMHFLKNCVALYNLIVNIIFFIEKKSYYHC